MFPDLFSIGPLTIHTYGLFVATGFFIGLLITILLGKSEGIDQKQVMDMGLIIILSAIIGSRAIYVIMNISYYTDRPLDIFKIWQGGLVFSGGITSVLLVMLWYGKRHRLSFFKIADLWVPGAAIGQGIGRIGCFMAGCCYGKPTDAKWGVVFTHPHSLAPLNVSLHPTQMYSSISGVIVFFILLLIYSKRKFKGQVFVWFLILHSTARLAIERFRGDDRGILLGSNMTITQFITIIILISSLVILTVLKLKAGKQSLDV